MRKPKKKSLPQVKIPLDLSAGTPEEIWNDFFLKRKPKSKEVASIILQLHSAGKHKHVIAAIRSALINGQSQPWMYEVLAVSLKLDKRPKAEIDRAFSSQVDFTSADVTSMMYIAAYLSRLDSQSLALRMYKQASKIEPTRPEPYVLGLKIARQLNDYDGIGWATSGILTYAWTRNHQKLHKEAEDTAAQAVKELLAKGDRTKAEAIRHLIQQAKIRDLTIRLTWTGDGDLDLAVEEPLGTNCSYKNPQTRSGGVLIHDGYGPVQANCHEDYVCAQGTSGIYRLRITHAGGSIVGKRAQLTIVRYQGTSKETTQQMTIPIEKKGTSVRLAIKKGRRKKLLSAVIQQRTRIAQRTRRGSLLQMLGGGDAASRRATRSFKASRNRNDILQKSGGPQVGFQPVITTLSEGVTMSAMAVISGDRRYVRLSVAPSFNAITDVFTFSFVNNGGNPTGNPGVGGGGNGN